MNEDADPTFHLNLLSQHLSSSPLKIPMENDSMIHFLWITWFSFFFVGRQSFMFFCGGGGARYWKVLAKIGGQHFFASYSSTSPPLWDLLRGFLVLACLCLDSPPSRGVIALPVIQFGNGKKGFSGTWTRIEDVLPIEHGGVFPASYVSLPESRSLRILVDIMSDLWCMLSSYSKRFPWIGGCCHRVEGHGCSGLNGGLGRPMNVPTFKYTSNSAKRWCLVQLYNNKCHQDFRKVSTEIFIFSCFFVASKNQKSVCWWVKTPMGNVDWGDLQVLQLSDLLTRVGHPKWGRYVGRH